MKGDYDIIGDHRVYDCGPMFLIIGGASGHFAVFGKGTGGHYLIADGYADDRRHALASALRIVREQPNGGLSVVQ